MDLKAMERKDDRVDSRNVPIVLSSKLHMDKNITDTQKLILGLITGCIYKYGHCNSSNRNLAVAIGHLSSNRSRGISIGYAISQLRRKGYVHTTCKPGHFGINRNIKLTNKSKSNLAARKAVKDEFA